MESTNHYLQWIFLAFVVGAILSIKPLRNKAKYIFAKTVIFLISCAIIGRTFVFFGLAENSQFPSNPTRETILHFMYLWGSILIGSWVLFKTLIIGMQKFIVFMKMKKNE